MLQPKKSTTKKPNPIKKYKKTSSGDSLGEDIFEIMDPTGISSYDDVYRSYKDNGLLSWQTGLEILGVLPIIGKAGKGIKIATTSSKYLKALSKTNKITAKAEKVLPAVLKAGKDFGKSAQKVSKAGQANPIAAAAIATSFGAQGLQKVTKAIEKTTKKGVKEIIKKTPANKRVINETVATVNSANTLSDVAGAVQNQVISPIKEKIVTPIASDIKEFIDKDSYQPIPKKTVYYNTDPKRGEVEKAGTETNVQYVPVSNSAELKMWQEQKLGNGTPEEGLQPNLLSLSELGINKNLGDFNLNSSVNFNPNDLTARIGAAFNKGGFNSSADFAQKESGNYSINSNVGYESGKVQGGLEYAKTGDEEVISGNLAVGNKLKLLLGYLKDQEGQNFSAGIQDSVAIGKGSLNGNLTYDTNYKDPKVSGGLNYTDPSGRLNVHAGGSYSDKEKINANAGISYNFALGTNKEGIMKTKRNLRKYATGSDAKGMNPNHYIISPAEAMNDYNIMLAKAEAEAMSDPWLPIVGMIGGAMQTGIGIAGGIAKNRAINGTGDDQSEQKANGTSSIQKDAEVEGGERYKTPAGQTGEFKGPSHAEDGIPLEVTQDPTANPEEGQAPEGTIVYSDRLKVGDKTIAERQEARENKTEKLEKQASDGLADLAIKNTIKRKMAGIKKEETRDLDFQEKVNNIQQMADTMIAAFGTGMAGVQKYAGGTSEDGIDPKTKIAFDNWLWGNVSEIKKKYPKQKDSDSSYIDNPDVRKDFQTFLFRDKAGTKDADNNYSIDGDFGKTTNAFAQQYNDISNHYEDLDTSVAYDMYPRWKLDDKDIKEGTFKAPKVVGENGESGAMFTPLETDNNNSGTWKQALEVPDLVAKGKAGIEEILTGNTTKKVSSKEPSKAAKLLEANMPAIGDLTKLFGNYLSATAGIKTANEQRSTDVTHTNVFANAGKESQRLLDNAKQGIEAGKTQAIVRATANTRGSKKSGRNSARGVNQMRGIDWLYDSALQAQIGEISANAIGQLSNIDVQKSGVAMNADQLKGQGEYQAAMANEAAKDAYYTALGLGRKDQATAVQQTGKDLNDMKENKLIEKLMQQYGKWVKPTASGVLEAANKTTTPTEQILVGPGGIKYKVVNGELIAIPK